LIGSCVVSVSLVGHRARAGPGPARSLRRDKLILRRAVLTRPARRRDEQNIRVLARTIQFSKNRLFSPDPVPFVVVRRTFQDYGKASYLSSPLLTSARLLASRGRVKGGGAGRGQKNCSRNELREQSSAATCRGVGSDSSGRQPQPAGHAQDQETIRPGEPPVNRRPSETLWRRSIALLIRRRPQVSGELDNPCRKARVYASWPGACAG
jgi:hypothetical protein